MVGIGAMIIMVLCRRARHDQVQFRPLAGSLEYAILQCNQHAFSHTNSKLLYACDPPNRITCPSSGCAVCCDTLEVM